MPRVILLRVILKVLRIGGFFLVSQKGSHAKYRKVGNPTRTVIVPIHGKEVPYRTFRSIVRQSNMDESDFFDEV